MRRVLRKVHNRYDGQSGLLLVEQPRIPAGEQRAAARILVDGSLYALFFDPADGALAVSIPESCLMRSAGRLAPGFVEIPGYAPPDLQHRVTPRPPATALRERRSGVVALEAVVDDRGEVTEVCVAYASPIGLGFEEAAIDAVRQWRYSPARLEGRPVELVFRATVRFSFPFR